MTKAQVLINSLARVTPVQETNGIYFKRDDDFRLWDSSPVNGGKLRQCAYLIARAAMAHGRELEGIIAACDINSPHGAIIAAVCNQLDLRCRLYISGEPGKLTVFSSIKKGIEVHRCLGESMAQLATRIAYSKSHSSAFGEFWETINPDFSPDAKSMREFYELNAKQVQNIPDGTENLIISCESGVTAIGILTGLAIYKKRIPNIYIVGVSSNRELITIRMTDFLSQVYGYDYNGIEPVYVDCTLAHPDPLDPDVYPVECGEISLHPGYEGRAYNWMLNQNYMLKKKTCFWITGAGSE